MKAFKHAPHIEIREFPDEASWLAGRKSGVGGSTAAAILRRSKYEGPVDVYLEKIKGKTKEFDETSIRRMAMGHVMEPVICKLFEEKTGYLVRQYNYTIFVNPKYPLLYASLDGAVYKDQEAYDNNEPFAILECKNVGGTGVKSWAKGVPENYRVQVEEYMIALELPKAYVCALVDGWDLKVYEVEQDEGLTEELIEGVTSFWNNHIIPQVPPEPKTGAEVELLYNEALDEAVVADDTTYNKVYELAKLKKEASTIKDSIDVIEDELKVLLKNKTSIVAQDDLEEEKISELVTWKFDPPGVTFDTKNFKKDHPDLAKAYEKPKAPTRRFLSKIKL